MNDFVWLGWVQVGVLALLVVLIGVVVLYLWRHPQPSMDLERLQKIEERQKGAETALDELRKQYNLLAGEYMRIVGENAWLRQVLDRNGITIPPLPDYLKPHTDSAGNIVLSVHHGGIDISGGSVRVEKDLVAGDARGS